MSVLATFEVMPVNPRPPSKVGETLRVSLDQTIQDHTGHDVRGPHPCGRATVLADGRLSIALLDTTGGRWAAGLLADDLVDVVLWQGTV